MKKEIFKSQKQEFVSPTQAVGNGKAPRLKVKLLSNNGETQNYVLVFSAGDEVRSGLNEFAEKYQIKSAHYTAIGSAFSVKLGFFKDWYEICLNG